MGAWGVSLLSNDNALDVIGGFVGSQSKPLSLAIEKTKNLSWDWKRHCVLGLAAFGLREAGIGAYGSAYFISKKRGKRSRARYTNLSKKATEVVLKCLEVELAEAKNWDAPFEREAVLKNFKKQFLRKRSHKLLWVSDNPKFSPKGQKSTQVIF